VCMGGFEGGDDCRTLRSYSQDPTCLSVPETLITLRATTYSVRITCAVPHGPIILAE
jgi:hypothetical protein